jgi:hypothetical protein
MSFIVCQYIIVVIRYYVSVANWGSSQILQRSAYGSGKEDQDERRQNARQRADQQMANLELIGRQGIVAQHRGTCHAKIDYISKGGGQMLVGTTPWAHFRLPGELPNCLQIKRFLFVLYTIVRFFCHRFIRR